MTAVYAEDSVNRVHTLRVCVYPPPHMTAVYAEDSVTPYTYIACVYPPPHMTAVYAEDSANRVEAVDSFRGGRDVKSYVAEHVSYCVLVLL
jgi:hypothetical protein